MQGVGRAPRAVTKHTKPKRIPRDNGDREEKGEKEDKEDKGDKGDREDKGNREDKGEIGVQWKIMNP